jgi:DNA-binding NarL/FixJ family response regulator
VPSAVTSILTWRASAAFRSSAGLDSGVWCSLSSCPACSPPGTIVEGAKPIRGVQPIRLGIVDDHPVFRLGLKRAFEREADLEMAWELGSANDLLATLASSPVDVVLMDLNLGPDQDSLAATRAVIHRYPAVKVIIISASLDGDAAAAAKAVGAIGYLPKDLSVPDTMAAIRDLAAKKVGEIVFGDFLATSAGANGRKEISRHGLTRREQEVLVELRRGRTNREIATMLGVSIATVNKHVQQVLKKLHVRNRSQAVARLHADAAWRSYQAGGGVIRH